MTTTEEVIRLAREANIDTLHFPLNGKKRFVMPLIFPELARLIDLVRAEENEACSKVCDSYYNHEAKDCAEDIRARMKP